MKPGFPEKYAPAAKRAAGTRHPPRYDQVYFDGVEAMDGEEWLIGPVTYVADAEEDARHAAAAASDRAERLDAAIGAAEAELAPLLTAHGGRLPRGAVTDAAAKITEAVLEAWERRE
jgi:hypothetical protein